MRIPIDSPLSITPEDIFNEYYKVNNFTLVYDNRYDRDNVCHGVIWGQVVHLHLKSWQPTGVIFAMTAQRGDLAL